MYNIDEHLPDDAADGSKDSDTEFVPTRIKLILIFSIKVCVNSGTPHFITYCVVILVITALFVVLFVAR